MRSDSPSNAIVETTKGLMARHVAVTVACSPEEALEAVEAEFRTDEIVTAQSTLDTIQRAIDRLSENES